MDIETLKLEGSPERFQALRDHLYNWVNVEFADVLKSLDEALVDYNGKKEFEPIATYLRFATEDPYSHSARNQIFVDEQIHSNIIHFTEYDPRIVKVFEKIISYVRGKAHTVHVMEEFQLDAADEGIPVMVLVVHGDENNHKGLIVKAKYNAFKWVIPNETHMKQGWMGYRAYTDFDSTIEDFIETYERR